MTSHNNNKLPPADLYFLYSCIIFTENLRNKGDPGDFRRSCIWFIFLKIIKVPLQIRIFLILLGFSFLAFSQSNTLERDSIGTTHHLHEIEITAWYPQKLLSELSAGKIELNVSELNSLPRFLGETDALRTLKLLPGVLTTGELNSGLYIRGSEPSHSQILLNGVPLYNAMHLLGFFSVFNSNHMNTFTLYKSHLDASKGGRLSASVEMETRNELVSKPTISGNVGIISAQLTAALPLGKKASIYLSGRKTYLGLIVKPITTKTSDTPADYDFEDYNSTLVFKPSHRDRLMANFYYGRDYFDIEAGGYLLNGMIKWNNLAASIQWDRHFDKTKTMRHIIYLAQYKNKLSVLQNQITARLPSSITDYGYKSLFSVQAGRFTGKCGLEYIYHHMYPQNIESQGAYLIQPSPGSRLYRIHEGALFLNGEYKFSTRLSAEIGLRYSGAAQLGPFDHHTYRLGEIVATRHFKKGELMKFYGGIEPRVAIYLHPTPSQQLSLSYNLTRQYIGQVSSSSIGFPTDFWMPASLNIPPQHAHSLAAGYAMEFNAREYEASAELYYKRLYNQMESAGALIDMISQQYIIEDKIYFGRGNNYGMELMFRKNKGRLTGWISYALGWAYRQTPQINQGRAYPAKQDRRHDLSITARYQINRHWDCAATFVYATGNALTMPESLYIVGENVLCEYGPYNGGRMPAYHRTDLSVNYWITRKSKTEQVINFSLYNAYNRKNPVYLNVGILPAKEASKQNTYVIRKRGKSLYGIIPSISYSFKF